MVEWVEVWEEEWVETLGATTAETTCSRDKGTWAWAVEWVEEINGVETKEITLVVAIKVDLDKAIQGHKSGEEIREGTTEVWVVE